MTGSDLSAKRLNLIKPAKDLFRYFKNVFLFTNNSRNKLNDILCQQLIIFYVSYWKITKA
jgi:hypothetical protein